MLIDNLKPEYADGISIVENECFSMPWKKETFLQDSKRENAIYSVAVDEKVVGYIGGYLIIDTVYINNIAVLPSHRKNGIGNLLLEDFLKKCGSNTVTLEVRVSNYPAISLYEKFGFKNVGIRKGFYEKPKEDAIIMIREG